MLEGKAENEKKIPCSRIGSVREKTVQKWEKIESWEIWEIDGRKDLRDMKSFFDKTALLWSLDIVKKPFTAQYALWFFMVWTLME